MRKIRLFFVAVAMVFVGFLFSERAFATIAESDTIYQKAFYKGVLTCYKANDSDGGLKSTIELNKFDGSALGFFNGNKEAYKPIVAKVGPVGSAQSLISCYDLLTSKMVNNLLKTSTSDFTEKARRLESAFYEKEQGTTSVNNDKKCYSYKYKAAEYNKTTSPEKYVGEKEYYTPQLCVTKDENNNFVFSINEMAGQYSYDTAGNLINPIRFSVSRSGVMTLKVIQNGIGNTKVDYDPKKLPDEGFKIEAQVLSSVGDTIAKYLGGDAANSKYSITYNYYDEEQQAYQKYHFKYFAACQSFTAFSDNSGIRCDTNSAYSQSFGSQPDGETKYKKLSLGGEGDYTDVILGYSGEKYDYETIRFDDDEKYRLYQNYLVDVYGVESVHCSDIALQGVGDYKARLWWKDEGKYSEYCYFNVDKKHKDTRVYGVASDGTFGQEIGLDQVIWTLDGLENTADPGTAIGDVPDDPTPPGDGGSGETDICYANSGALGWIVCPIITALHGIGNKMWNQIETYHMVVPASEVFKSGGGVDKGWGLVRDIANVLFVILFLVVIFSQLTGVGIDNYGIKKILPRLIVVAILVNLSYIICELAVDLSNILGMGLNNMLSNLAGNLATAGDGASTGGQVAAWTLTGIFAVGGTFLWGLLNAGSAVGALIWIGLAVLGIAIMIIVAMLFLYLTLVVREAGIVLSIVLAPVAIVCYALPNTEKLGKKWFDLFKALLLVYPICGAMIGGGQLAGSILASIDNDGMKLAAAIVQVAPFFFIPMVLRNSLSLMGNVGAKLSSLGRSWGRKASGFAQNTIKSTNRYKDFTQYQQSQAAARRAQRVQARLRERQEAGETLSERQLNRLRKADDTMIEYEKAQRADRASGRGSNYEARMAAIADNERSQRIKERETLMATDNNYRQMTEVDLRTAWNNMANDANADSEEFQALTGYYVSRYGAAAVNQIARSMGNWNVTGNGAQNVAHRNRVQDLRQVRSDDKDFAALLRNKAPDADSMVADGARVGDSYANLEHFTNNQNTATAIKDWVGASTATLQRSVGAQRTEGDNAGEYVITTRQLQEMLTSTDPAIQSGLRSEDGKYEQVAGEYYNRTHGTNLDRREAARLYDQEQRDNAAMAQNRQNQMSSNVERIANSLEGMGGNRFDVPHRNGGGAPTPPTPPVDPRDAIPRNYGDSPDAGTDAGAGADNNYE